MTFDQVSVCVQWEYREWKYQKMSEVVGQLNWLKLFCCFCCPLVCADFRHVIPMTFIWTFLPATTSKAQSALHTCLPLWLCHVHLLGAASRGGDVAVYASHKPTGLAHSFLFCSCVYFCLCGLFNCISFHQFSGQLSFFWLCSSGLISLSLIGPFNFMSLYESLLQPWYNP